MHRAASGVLQSLPATAFYVGRFDGGKMPKYSHLTDTAQARSRHRDGHGARPLLLEPVGDGGGDDQERAEGQA